MNSHRGEGAPLPVPSNKRWWKVIAAKGQIPLRVIFLSDSFFGVWTHWIKGPDGSGGMTVPCTQTPECPFDRGGAGCGSRWTGYAPVLSGQEGAEAVVALTEGAARQLLETLARRGTLRGCEFELKRSLPKPNAPIGVRLIREHGTAKLPPAFDIYDSLSRLWGVNMDYYKRKQLGSGMARPGPADDSDQGDLVPV